MLRRFINGLVDLAYPRVCLGCKNKISASSAEKLICPECWGKIKKNTPPFCHSCGRHLEKNNLVKNICPGCLKKKLYFDRAFSPCVYDGIIKNLIHDFKYKNKDYLGKPLSKLMIEFTKAYSLPIGDLDFIIPMPLSKAKLREREFNQAEVLSKHIAEEFKKDVLSDILLRHRHTRTQTDLEINERFENVRNSFSVTKNEVIKGKHLLLVDDVLTTGATSSEAALTLKNAGANIVFVLTLAN